jgi:adenylate cyclase
VAGYSVSEVAQRAGVSEDVVRQIVDFGILTENDGGFTSGEVRKVGLISSLVSGGIPFEALAEAFRAGSLAFDFLDNPGFDHFSALSPMTFSDLAQESGVPVELLLVIREAIGSAVAEPTDFVREIELSIVPAVQAELEVGYPPAVVERLLRTTGESLRRTVLAEADAFRQHVIGPVGDQSGKEIGDTAERAVVKLSEPVDRALLAIFHAQQAHAWTSNMLAGFEATLAEAGVFTRATSVPAMCFLDITGYTRLTGEQGDIAAAQLAETLTRLVQRTAVQHGGRPVKWLGDGVMLYFPSPGAAVVAAIEMREGITSAGLPPAHIGIHAGRVLFQDGDYYGQTVNVASRIATYARPGEVLVSQTVVDASDGAAVSFTDLGPVELKGVSEAVHLHVASRG